MPFGGHRAVIHLGAALPWRSSSLPGSGASSAIASLFGLAPDGVCRASPVASPAVGFYPTISPLPDLALREPSAVCFLLHFPSPRGARRLAGILLCGARTFLRAMFHARRLPSGLPKGRIIAPRPLARQTAKPQFALPELRRRTKTRRCRRQPPQSRPPAQCAPVPPPASRLLPRKYRSLRP